MYEQLTGHWTQTKVKPVAITTPSWGDLNIWTNRSCCSWTGLCGSAQANLMVAQEDHHQRSLDPFNDNPKVVEVFQSGPNAQ